MGIWTKGSAGDVRRKNRWKAVKTVVQAVVLLVVAGLIYRAVWGGGTYAEPDKGTWSNDKGFIALSYFGVGRSGTPKLIAKDELNRQLKALHDQGYRTISQQDILDYYAKGTPLPDKALFLSFEDGRNDSALFAQPLLERYNDKATFLSYAGKLGNGDNKFLQANEMLKMQKTGYWELGSNGYRLSYINVFDKDGDFLGQRTESGMKNKSTVAYYNHYLMDFVRDENMIPTENRQQMEARIAKDYDLMKDVYTKKLGAVPGLYMIMHANSLGNGMNPLVTAINEKEIEGLFAMHFAREGVAFNGKGGNVYDLTRVQPQPYWSTNHLLMKIGKDTGQAMTFVRGEKSRASDWTTAAGAAFFDENEIVLTSPAGSAGLMALNGSETYGDVAVTAKLEGNVVGKQGLYLRYDGATDSYVRVVLADNEIAVEQKKPGEGVERLFAAKLSDVNWDEEDLALSKAAVYTKAQTAAGLGAAGGDGAGNGDGDGNGKSGGNGDGKSGGNGEGKSEVSGNGGSEDQDIPVNVRKTRDVGVELVGGKLTLKIDGKTLLSDRAIDSSIGRGGIALSAEASKANEKDDIYDGHFVNVTVKAIDADGSRDVLYRDTNEGLQGAINGVKHTVGRVVDWVIETF